MFGGSKGLLVENGNLKKQVAELKGRLSKHPGDEKKENPEDPVLSALDLAPEEVLDRKDYGEEAVVVTRDGRKLRYEKESL